MTLEFEFSQWLELKIGKTLVILLNEFINNGTITPNQSVTIIDHFKKSCTEVLNKYVKSGRKLKCEGNIDRYNCIEGNWNILLKDVVIFGKSLGRVKSKYIKLSGNEYKYKSLNL